jgi:lysophospholipase L1-like esterase
MDVRGKKVLVFGDSLSASDGAPGGVLAARLRDAGAIVRRNGRVSRSAVNLFSGKNGENGAAVIAAEVSYRPDIVLVVLGTNDMGLNAQADAAAFTRIRDAFTTGGAKVYAIGPPAFSRADHARESVVVYDTLGRVFGAGNVIDWRALSGDQVSPPARSADLVHFTSAGAQVAGQRLAAAVLAHRVPIWGSASPKLRAWWPVPVTAAVAAAGLIGAAVYVRRRRRLAGIAGRGVTKREGTGFYTGTHRGHAFELVKVQGHQAWYWRIPADNEGGEDWFSSKREALAAVKDWIDQRGDVKLRGPEALPASERQHVHRVIEPEIDGAVERALAAGAKAPLEYIGAGAEGIVFCDPTQTAYKVGRGANSLADEAQFFRKATQVPGVKEHVAKFKRYDAKHNVIVRECVRGERIKWSQEHKVYDLHRDIEKTMEPYGFLSPERKPDSWVLVRGRGPVLVDAGFATPVGRELVKHTLDVINGRSPRGAYESNESLAFHIRNERGKTIPTKVANKILQRLYETPQNARKWGGSDEAAQVFGE